MAKGDLPKINLLASANRPVSGWLSPLCLLGSEPNQHYRSLFMATVPMIREFFPVAFL
jgi:hypothetical protein